MTNINLPKLENLEQMFILQCDFHHDKMTLNGYFEIRLITYVYAHIIRRYMYYVFSRHISFTLLLTTSEQGFNDISLRTSSHVIQSKLFSGVDDLIDNITFF